MDTCYIQNLHKTRHPCAYHLPKGKRLSENLVHSSMIISPSLSRRNHQSKNGCFSFSSFTF